MNDELQMLVRTNCLEPRTIRPWWVKHEWNPASTGACDCVRCGARMGLSDGAEWDEEPAYNFCHNCAHSLVRECMDKLNGPDQRPGAKT